MEYVIDELELTLLKLNEDEDWLLNNGFENSDEMKLVFVKKRQYEKAIDILKGNV